ncbi:MAG: ASKHA domain-containing protein [Oscillospiraceae bacterium]|nr:ASKHA domain-containing protein [Oscillospiraceae bacterium]
MAKVTLIQDGNPKRFNVPDGAPLMPLLQDTGALAFPCAGNHLCGKCRVKAVGKVSAITPSERALLGNADAHVRLACFLKAEGDCEVTVGNPEFAQILTESAAVRKPLDPIYTGYGAAFDIGTTTVAGYLYSDGHPFPIQTAGEPNRQASFGADVISRIEACADGGLPLQRDVIRTQISQMLGTMCKKSGIRPQDVRTITAAGNTVMLHLLAGFDPNGLAAVPFEPVSLFGNWQDWHLDGFTEAEIYLPACISAYVGADITCSILASGMLEMDGLTLLLDIGTNGEMALLDGTNLFCCSTAAGPAFEGAGISCGSGAVSGAVHMVHTDGDSMCYDVIGGGTPKSLCGSGLLDAAAAFLRLGMLDKSGLIMQGETLPIADSGLLLTQQDIRQLQLAKGAVIAGIETLLCESGIHADKVDRVLLCGGFGNFIKIPSAVQIGLLAPSLAAKTQTIGNAAGAGAGMLLQSKQAFYKSREIAQQAKTLDLSGNAYFMERFVENMLF